AARLDQLAGARGVPVKRAELGRARVPVMRRATAPVVRLATAPVMRLAREPVVRRAREPVMRRATAPVMRRAVQIALLGVVGLMPRHGHAEVWLGAFAGVPGDGSGAPVMESHVPVGLSARRSLGWSPTMFGAALETSALAGLGLPIAGVGASAWGGLELRLPLARRVALTTAPGLRTGFVGPGYYARRSDVFVGYDYIHAGPWTIAPRLPLGLAVAITGRLEAFGEVVAELPLLPSPELLLGGALGVRVRL
ncbi:MAG: hypothetical protein ABIY55_29710, partial [Kofleriaceae bacterium]